MTVQKKILALVALFTVLAVTVSTSAAAYSDLPSAHWAADAVGDMSRRAILSGYPDGSFLPDETVTYGEFIKMAVLALGNSDPGNHSRGNWAEACYDAALEQELFSKYDISSKQLDYSIPRSDMALIAGAALGEMEIEHYSALQALMKDVTAETRHEYAIMKSFAAGVLTGYPDRTFRPDENLSRAEAAMVIYRLLEPGKRRAPDPGQTAQLERFLKPVEDAANFQGFYNLIKTSVSTRPISEMADNQDEFSMLRHLKYYEIMDVYPYEMKIGFNMVGGENLDMGTGERIGNQALMIKDRKITLLDRGNSQVYVPDHCDAGDTFPDWDYLGFYTFVPDMPILILIPAPEK